MHHPRGSGEPVQRVYTLLEEKYRVHRNTRELVSGSDEFNWGMDSSDVALTSSI